jgi:hypothetical protein
MKLFVIFIAMVSVLGCKNAEKNPGSREVPEAMTCPGSLDPNQACPDAIEATGRVKAGRPNQPVKPDQKPINNMISGTCEMRVKGEPKPRTCEDLELTVTSERKKDVHHAEISGFNVKFTDLSEKSYRFHAASEKYWVRAKTGELSPGQIVKIRVFAKPRTQK